MENEITKEQFKQYRIVQDSGVTNMFDVAMVSELSGLTRKEVISVIQNYSQLEEKYETSN